MKMSRQGIIALAVSEGLVDTAYLDSVGIWTWGIGHTKAAGSPDPIKMRGRKATYAEVMEVFAKDLPDYESIVNRNVKVPLTQQQFDALVHFAYNVGEGNFKKSRLLANINAGKYEIAGKSGFHGWLKPPEIRSRRDKESKIFLHGIYGSTLCPVYTANFSGKQQRTGTVDLDKILPQDTVPVNNSCNNQGE